MSSLSVFAGENAFQHIRKHGLSATDIDSVMGASGAAKWLAIAGLDKAVFGRWLAASTHEIALYGTSVGAFKLAAAAHDDPESALDRLATAYIMQSYSRSSDADAIDEQMGQIIDAVAGAGSAEQVLNHVNFRLQFSAVRCLDPQLASVDRREQQKAMLRMFFANLLSHDGLNAYVQRINFHDARLSPVTELNRVNHNNNVALSVKNFRQALMASGSLPVYMHPIKDISGAMAGVYRDGGLLDYHPVPRSPLDQQGKKKLVLYPHFYSTLTEVWFDKFLFWRKVAPERLANVVLLVPSPAYIASLEGGVIPNRQDFKKFMGRDDERMRRWEGAVSRSEELGELFLDWTKNGDIAANVQPI